MSDHATTEPKPEYFDYKHVGTRFLFVSAVAIAALLLALLTPVFVPELRKQFAYSWLFAFTFFMTICMGGLFWQLVHYGTDAEWSVVVRRQMENLASLLPVMALLFIPLVFVAPELWKWMRPENANDPLLIAKQAYLNKPFFWGRAIFYFVFFTVAALWFRRNSIVQDGDGSPAHTVLSRKLAFAFMPLFAVSLTFSAIDWLMGLDYHWFSTMWGVYIFAGTALSSMCVLVLVISALRSAGYLQHVITLEHYHIMGKLMLAFTVFWAYIGFSQYMLIWYSNIPEETVYFLLRNTESWNYLNIALVIGHFFVPFVLLLQQPLKKKPFILCGIAVWILVMHVLDIYIIVLPVLHRTGVQPSWLDLVCLIAIGFTLVAVFLKRLGEASLYPTRDPRVIESLGLKN